MISFLTFYDIILLKEEHAMKPNIEELCKKYIDNPPEGMTSKDIRHMRADELLDMDYFLNEDALFDDEAGVECFYIFVVLSSFPCTSLSNIRSIVSCSFFPL